MEMAFVKSEEVMEVVARCVQRMFKAAIDLDITLPLPRMSYKEAMDRFGVDRPDTRFGLELHDVTELLRDTDFSVFKSAIESDGVIKCIVVPGGESLTRKIIDGLTDELRGIGAGGLPLVKVTDQGGSPQVATGIAKFIQPLRGALCEKLGAKTGDAIFFMPGTYADVSKYLHYARTRLAEITGVIPENRWDLLWIVDFPLVEQGEEDQRWYRMHHQFTASVTKVSPLIQTDPG